MSNEKQYVRDRAEHIEKDLHSDATYRAVGAVRVLAQARPAYQGQPPEYVRGVVRHVDYLDAAAIQCGFAGWREVEPGIGGTSYPLASR